MGVRIIIFSGTQMFIDHLILGPVDVALQEVAQVRVVVLLRLVALK